MKQSPRIVYCGTCKSLGSLYGQRSRLLLNRDTVFLAEILLDLECPGPAGSALRSRNCLKLPQHRSEIPLALQYAAAVTILLAHFRVADHRDDARRGLSRKGWSVAGRVLSPSYQRAAAQLRAWGFPIEELVAILGSQAEREAAARSVDDVAEPTMLATGLVFAQGVKLAGRQDRAEDARRLGAKFGKLIYLLDAFEDRESDARSGAFNPYLAFAAEYGDASRIRGEISHIANSLELEMPPELAARLRSNVEERLGLGETANALGDWRSTGRGIGWVQPQLAFAASMPPPPPPPPQPPPQSPPPPRGQFRVARPDRPGTNFSGASLCDGCKDSCMEGIIEAICDSVCSG